jgi:hypothetical protein
MDTVENPHENYESFPTDRNFVALRQWPRRLDFLHEIASDLKAEPATSKPYFIVLPACLLKIDLVPVKYSQFGLLVPSILHKIEVQLIVSELCMTLLTGIDISDKELVRAAIGSPNAREQDDYEKLEFLGDSVLKYIVIIFISSKCKRSPSSYNTSYRENQASE